MDVSRITDAIPMRMLKGVFRAQAVVASPARACGAEHWSMDRAPHGIAPIPRKPLSCAPAALAPKGRACDTAAGGTPPRARERCTDRASRRSGARRRQPHADGTTSAETTAQFGDGGAPASGSGSGPRGRTAEDAQRRRSSRGRTPEQEGAEDLAPRRGPEQADLPGVFTDTSMTFMIPIPATHNETAATAARAAVRTERSSRTPRAASPA
jgi:hypothetical protein